MVTFFQAVFGGLAQGCVYALIALGYSVIYSTLKMGHFAQGELGFLGVMVRTAVQTPRFCGLFMVVYCFFWEL